MKKRTHEEFVRELFEIYGDEYTPIGTYITSSHSVRVSHICGHEWNVYPLNLLKKKSGCPKCGTKRTSEKLRVDYGKSKNLIESRGYTLLSNEIRNAKQALDLVCPEGHSIKMNYNRLQQGQDCGKCAPKKRSEVQRKPQEEIESMIENLGYEILGWSDGLYKNNRTKVSVRCKNGHYSTKSVYSLQKNEGCPHCSRPSKNEVKIRDFLNKMKINFMEQYRFDDCRNIKPLPFDFAIFNGDGNLKGLIEYDGQQHFKPISKFGGEEGFKRLKENESIKNNYCLDRNIPLWRISYRDAINIESILKRIISS